MILADQVEQIENGRIEIENVNKQTRFIVKCNKHYHVNMNASSAQVVPLKLNSQNTWMPATGDLLVPNLPLCIRTCNLQANLLNGLIRVDSNFQLTSAKYIQIFQNTKVKFECLSGFQMRTKFLRGKTTRILYGKSVLIEKCDKSGLDKSALIKLLKKSSVSLESKEEDDDDDNDDDDDDDSDDKSDKEEDSDVNMVHECVKLCTPPKMYLPNGFLVPIRTNYRPGEHLKFLCNEGYVAEMPVRSNSDMSEFKLSNQHQFECSTNGTWHSTSGLVYKSAELKKLLKCGGIDSFQAKTNSFKDFNNLWSTSLSYTELNIRTFTMMFAICACIMVLLVVSLITLRFYKRKRHDAVFRHNYSPQLNNPLLFSNENVNFSANTGDFESSGGNPSSTSNQGQSGAQTNDCVSTMAVSLAFGSIGSSSSLNRCNNMPPQGFYLPSYEEAITQRLVSRPPAASVLIEPPQQPVTAEAAPDLLNLNDSNPTTSSASAAAAAAKVTIAETTTRVNEPVRSRSGSIRSNLTLRSANGSIRTNNSIGAASFNLPPPSFNHRKSNVRSRRHHGHSNHLNFKQQHQRVAATRLSNTTVFTQTSNTSELTSTTAATNSSLFSNESNASKIGLHGSISNVETVSNDDSNSSQSFNVVDLPNIQGK